MRKEKRESSERKSKAVPGGNTVCLLLCVFLCVMICGCRDGGKVLILEPDQEETDEIGLDEALETGQISDNQPDGVSNEPSIVVYVCGAVHNPGVISLPEGSRICDAVEAAGGLTEEAGEGTVNLAALAEDGEMIRIPTEEEAAAARQEADSKGIVNINTADISGLCTLPGIGESRAGDIIAYRESGGGFKKIEDIMKVPGIKEGAFQKIKDKITVE